MMRKINDGSVERVAASVLKGWYAGRHWAAYTSRDGRIIYIDIDSPYYALILPRDNPLDPSMVAGPRGVKEADGKIPVPPGYVDGPWADVQASDRTDAPFKYQLYLSDEAGKTCTVDSRFVAKIARDTGERGLVITGGDRPVVAVCDYTGRCLGYVLPVVGSINR